MPDPLDLEPIRARLAAVEHVTIASNGPGTMLILGPGGTKGRLLGSIGLNDPATADPIIAFLARAPLDVAALLAEVEGLRGIFRRLVPVLVRQLRHDIDTAIQALGADNSGEGGS